jgi:hypothetical protein
MGVGRGRIIAFADLRFNIGDRIMAYQIKNWSKFQHYKSGRGAPPWIKLYRDLLNDPEWFELPPEAAKFLVSCWILAAETDGILPDSKTLAFRLRVDSKKIDNLLSICNHWIIQDDSTMLASCYQVAIPETETETDKEIEYRHNKSSRGTRLPPDWKPKLEDGFDEVELAKFRDYWIAVSGQKGVKRDWDATWRNWLRNAKQWDKGSPRNAFGKNGEKPNLDTFRIGHPKGVIKFEPEKPKLTEAELAERAKFVEKTLKGLVRAK